MQKYLIVALLAVTTAIPAFGTTPVAEHSEGAHVAAVHSKPKTHTLTAAQRRARVKRLAHERAVKRTAEKQRPRRTARRTTVAHRTVARRRVAHRTVRHRVAARRTVAHRRVVRRTAAHRTSEARLTRERRLRAHRAYEARLAHERWLRSHRAYARRLAARRDAEQAKAAVAHRDATEIAKVDVPKAISAPVTGMVHGAQMDYVSHEHVRLYWRSPLRGTHASLVRQDERDRAEGLTRIKDEAQLRELVDDRSLIPLPVNETVQTDPRLASDRRYTRPWTAEFLRDLGRTFMHRFGEPLVITSAVRPATYQERLTWRNGNAAPANGAIASPHEFGATIDIGKKGMTAREMAWMRGYLLPLQQAGQIDVEEEFYQACFHVTVYKNYVAAPMTRPQPEVADAQVDNGAR